MDPTLLRDCVHCGFCLPTCPTYELWHEEMDSPRGRIYLMHATVEGTLELPATGTKVARVGLLTGCVQSVLFGEVNRATARVLALHGYEVAAPYGGCCGALALHAGRREHGLELAHAAAAAFAKAGVDTIVTN